MRESRTYGSVRGARDETRVPTATINYFRCWPIATLLTSDDGWSLPGQSAHIRERQSVLAVRQHNSLMIATPPEDAASQRLLLQNRQWFDQVENLRHQSQDLCILWRKPV